MNTPPVAKGRSRKRKRPPDELLARVVKEKGGIYTLVAAACGVDVRTVQKWKERYPSVQKMFEETIEANLDFAEAKLMENIRKGKTAELIFYLKCKGKHRGYIERQEVTGADGQPLVDPRENLDRFQQRMRDPRVREAYERIRQIEEEVSSGGDGTGPAGDGVGESGGVGLPLN